MDDAYAYAEPDSQDADQAKQIARCVSKLKGSSRHSQLRVLAGLLEQLPQDLGALGSAKAREFLLESLSDRAILHSKQKDVRMYASACFAQLLRIYAPETPYDDKRLEPVFELLLWSIEQVQEYQAPTYEFAVSVLQTISQTKSYFIVMDWGREELLLDWVRVLLQCINAGSSALAGRPALEVLVGIVGEEGASEAVLELLLSQLVPPKAQENALACQLAQAVLKACESTVKPALQKYLTTLILSPISSNSDLHQHCYTLIYQLYMTVPQVLLPVIPHLTSELHSEDGAKRLEAATLLGRLLSLPGNRLVNEYRDVLDALLRRYSDTQVNVRLVMLDFTNSLVAAAGSEDLQQQVLLAAAERLQDYDEKVRLLAVKAVCQAAKQLLVGPTHTAAGPTGPGSANAAAMLSPVDALLGSLGESQELADAAAADLGVEAAANLGTPGAAVAAAAVRDLPFVQEALRRVYLRLRDTKPAVRKAAASHFLSIFRAVVSAGEGNQISKCCWLAARVLLCSKTDKEVREQLYEATAKDGLMAPKTPSAQAAAAWVRLWLASSELEREALLMLLTSRTRVQVDTLQLLALRRKLSGRQAGEEGSKVGLDGYVQQLAAHLPQPDRASETLGQLLQVKDNHAFSVMQAALAPGASAEAYAKARADALARVGSRSPAAEAVSQLLLWGHPAAWLPTPIMGALLELVCCEPEGGQAELVQAAYQLLSAVSKSAPLLPAGLLPELTDLVVSTDPELQQLGVQMVARCAAQMRKCGIVLSASTNAATAKLVRQQLLPSLRRIARAQPPAVGSPHSPGLDSQDGLLQVSHKAAKWAVFGLAACQDSSTTKQELHQLADELVGSLDLAEPHTPAKLGALSVVGRLLPDALSRYIETLLRFVTSDYFDAYIDAAAGAADMQGAGSGGRGRRQSMGSSMLLSPTSQGTASLEYGTQAAGAASLMLKCTALKALAAACVPDSDAQDAPVETLRVVVRLAEFLESLLEPGVEALPIWMSDASPELAGQLRLSAALALLRLARRHDTRISPGTYCTLALMMQDEVEGVRAVFAAKVYRLLRYFLHRPSTHQLSAKYAAMLPLAAADPNMDSKVKAARMLRTWVHERRAGVQAQMGAAARDAQEGGSTLQDLPEMMVPYGLYILAHHPDFPQEPAEADDPESYTPFQFMLQFMLQPLLVASGTQPAGHMAPALIKMCRTLKRTADAGEPPATTQLYSLCDMAANTIEGLAESMKLQLADLGQYAGGIILPRGLYRALDKADRVGDMSYLPPGYEYVPDPQPAAALAAPNAAPASAAAGRGRGRATAQPVAAGGGGSKRKAAAAQAAAQQAGAQEGGAGQAPKRARGAAAVDKPGGKGRGKGAAADSDDGWGSDEEDAPPSAQKGDQLTRRQQVLRQHHELRQRATAPLEDGDAAAGASEGSAGSAGDEEQEGDSQQQQRGRRQQAAKQAQQSKTQRQLKQQQLTFAAAAAADASSPAPMKRGRQRLQAEQPHVSPVNGAAGGSKPRAAARQHERQAEGSSGESPFAALANGAAHEEEEGEEEQAAASKRARAPAARQQQRGKPGKGDAGRGAASEAESGDVAMDEDQEQEAQQPAPRGRAAAGGRKTAKGAKAAPEADAGGRRVTRQRGAA